MDKQINEKARGTRNKKRGRTINGHINWWKGQGKKEHNKERTYMWYYERFKERTRKGTCNRNKKKQKRNMINEKAKEKGSGKDKHIWRKEKVLVIRSGRRGT